MGKFNKSTAGAVKTPTMTNVAGGQSYARADVRKEAAQLILNSLLRGDQYYEDSDSRVKRLFEACDGDPSFIAKAMVYARTVGNLRSVSHILAVGLAGRYPKLRPWFKAAIQRPDDMTEMVSLWNKTNPHVRVPNALVRAFADVLNEGRFDAYQLRKYAQEKAAVKLRDIVRLAHPCKNAELYGQLLNRTLPAIDTMSTTRSAGEGAAAAFDRMLQNKTLGYMAALKNIRNAVKDGLSAEGLDRWVQFITNSVAVQRSRQLPFRFWDAWKAVEAESLDRFVVKKIHSALETAFSHSVGNVELVNDGDRVAVLVDASGSMAGEPLETAKVMAAGIAERVGSEQVVIYYWADTCKEAANYVDGSPFKWITKAVPDVGCSTYVSAPLKELIRTKTAVNKIVILTDMQMYDVDGGSATLRDFLKQYTAAVKVSPKILFWNLAGYDGGTPINLSETGVSEVAGWSSSLFEVVGKLWDNPNALVEAIEAVEV